MLQSNIYNITKTNIKKKANKAEPINIKGNTLSYSHHHIPNSPPMNTPPNINVIRELYLNYLTSFKK